MASKPQSPNPPPVPVLDWQIACADVERAPARTGFETRFVATAPQLEAIVEALDLSACTALSVRISARTRAGGRYSTVGRLLAEIEQACGVTLDPVRTRLDIALEGDFCPAADIAQALPIEPNFDPESDDEPMAIIDGQLPVGQLAFEHLALAIDPFPRTAEAHAEAVIIEQGPDGQRSSAGDGDAEGGRGRQPNPFAALAKLKLGKDD